VLVRATDVGQRAVGLLEVIADHFVCLVAPREAAGGELVEFGARSFRNAAVGGIAHEHMVEREHVPAWMDECTLGQRAKLLIDSLDLFRRRQVAELDKGEATADHRRASKERELACAQAVETAGQ